MIPRNGIGYHSNVSQILPEEKWKHKYGIPTFGHGHLNRHRWMAGEKTKESTFSHESVKGRYVRANGQS